MQPEETKTKPQKTTKDFPQKKTFDYLGVVKSNSRSKNLNKLRSFSRLGYPFLNCSSLHDHSKHYVGP